MSLLGNVSNSSQSPLSNGEPPLKRLRTEKEEIVNEISKQSLRSSSTTALDRFLPSRRAMNQAQIIDTYFLKPPKTAYHQALMQAVAPNYSSKTLLNRSPAPSQTIQEPTPVWKIPNKPWRTYLAGNGSCSNDFYNHPLDWGRHVYFATDYGIQKLNPFTNEVSELISIPEDEFINSIKSSSLLDEVAIGNEASSLSLFDLQAQQISLIHKVNSIYGNRVFCIGWKKAGTELTIGLNHAIVHFDKRQKREAWALSLEFGQNNCSIDWNQSDVLLGTGNNANFLRVFDVRKIHGGEQEANPIYKFETKAGLKALQWNPYNPELLAMGAGISDKHLYLTDLKEMSNVCKKDVGYQISDLAWLDRENFVITTGFASADSEKLSVWHYRESVRSLKRIGVMSGLEESRALNLAKAPKSAKICSHCSSADGERQTVSIWELENIEETKEREKKRKQRPFSMKPLEIR